MTRKCNCAPLQKHNQPQKNSQSKIGKLSEREELSYSEKEISQSSSKMSHHMASFGMSKRSHLRQVEDRRQWLLDRMASFRHLLKNGFYGVNGFFGFIGFFQTLPHLPASPAQRWRGLLWFAAYCFRQIMKPIKR